MKMTRIAALLLFWVLMAAVVRPVNAQVSRGVVKEGLQIQSKILEKAVRYTVYLPFDYERSERFYPVVYLLHGYTDNDTGWLQFGEAHLIADEGIANRAFPPMILVMPDGGVSFYINNHDRSVRYDDFFTQEFIPYIESKYRIRAERQYRGIAGLSMGGYGSLVQALKHPDLFAACAALSAAVLTDEEVMGEQERRWNDVYGPVYGSGLKGQERLTDHFKTHSPLHIVRGAQTNQFKDLKLYIDCGDDDFLDKGNVMFHAALRDAKIAHEFRMRDGGHTWSYWRSGLPEALKFIGAGFHR